MAKIFDKNKKSVRVTGGESFNFDEFKKRESIANLKNVIFTSDEKKAKNRAKARKAMGKKK